MPDPRPPRPGPFHRLGGGAVLALHRMADRLDLVPPEFGGEAPVDTGDARATLAEWVRCFRHWAGYNPGQVFALKVGGGLLLAGILFFWLAIAVLL